MGRRRTSSALAVARTARSLPGLSCRDTESPETGWTCRSVMDTLSSTTLMVVSARSRSDRGEDTCGDKGGGR